MSHKQQTIYIALVFLVLAIANGSSVYGQGKLRRIRDAVRHNKPAKPKHDNSRDDDHRSKKRKDKRKRERNRGRNRNRNRNRDSAFEIVIGGLLTPQPEPVHVVHHHPAPVSSAPVISAQVVPPSVIVAEPEPVYQPVVTEVIESPIAEADYFSKNASNFDWGVRMSAVGGTDFDDIVFGRFDLLLQVHGGPGIDTSVTMIRESGMSFRDHLFLGDVNFVYEPVAGDNFRIRIGIGVNWLGDSYGGDAGFNMTSGFDWRLTNRATVSGVIDFGSIGDTDITHARLGLGRLVSPNTEWVVGYDYLDISGVTIGSAFTGLQFRF